MDERLRDPDEAYAEWYAWSQREVSSDRNVCLGSALAALRALEDGGDRAAAEQAARASVRGIAAMLIHQVSPRRRAYAEWYDWARRSFGGETARLHAAARSAVEALDGGASGQDAASAAGAAWQAGEPRSNGIAPLPPAEGQA